MKAQMLKIAGVKSEKEFYKRFPDEASFMKAHGKEFKKALLGERIKAGNGIQTMADAQSGQFASGNSNLGNNPYDIGKLMNNTIGKYAVPIGQAIGQIQDISGEKKKLRQAKQMQAVSDVALQASRTREEPIDRRYVRPEDMILQPNQLSNPYGEGTNVLGRNGLTLYGGGEIANTYAPGTLYDNLGYEPLDESSKKKAYYSGGKLTKAQQGWMKGTDLYDFADSGGSQFARGLITEIGGENAGGNLGGNIGSTLGTAVAGPVGGLIGQVGGQIIGGLLDRNPQKIRAAQRETNRNIKNMSFNNNMQGVQSQYGSYMEDGGNLTNPQLITKFGEHTMRELLAPDRTMDTLRTGGHLRQNVMDGDLQMYKGGAESISYNPFLPEGGETVEFRGPSHEEGGMNVAYGKNPVEVEGGEPAVKLQNGGGQSDLVVFGNLNIPKGMLNDPKAKGKFKSYIKDIAKQETHKNKIADKSIEALNALDVNTSFDKLSLSSYRANLMGANASLKELAEKKQDAAALQQAINDTAEERGIEADSLSKGKIKQAKKGVLIPKAGGGITEYMKNRTINLPVPGDLSTLPTPEIVSVRGQIKDIPEERQKEKFPWVDVINATLPYFRPTDAEPLDANQLLGEMYALSTNQLEPVQAQTYQPQLRTPYDISMQDQLNEITAQTRQAQRLAKSNPAAEAIIAAQAYGAKSNVLANQLRANQALKEQVYSGNQATLNDAQLKNLGIRDQQYERQAVAKSNTKAVAQDALNSIAAKYQQNKLENRTLQAYENLYNYRYDNKGRAINWNGLAQFSPYGSGQVPPNIPDVAEGREPLYRVNENGKFELVDLTSKGRQKSTRSPNKRNGDIVSSMKRL